jgi:hypothetical protein
MAAAGRAARVLSPARGAPLLGQKVVIGKQHRFGPLRAQLLPLVPADIAVRGQLHLGSLHVGRSILRLELRPDDGAVAGLIDRKRLGPHPMAILENAERAGVDFLTLRFLLLIFVLIFGHGSSHATQQRSGRNSKRTTDKTTSLRFSCSRIIARTWIGTTGGFFSASAFRWTIFPGSNSPGRACPKSAMYSRFPRKGSPDPCPRLR